MRKIATSIRPSTRIGADRGRAEHVERVPPRHVQAELAPPAHLVQADRRERADQREAGRERKQQRQHVVAEHQARQHEADHRIDQAEKHRVARHREEIVEAARERVLQVGQSDFADLAAAASASAAPDDHMCLRHSRPPAPLCCERPRRRRGHPPIAGHAERDLLCRATIAPKPARRFTISRFCALQRARAPASRAGVSATPADRRIRDCARI